MTLTRSKFFYRTVPILLGLLLLARLIGMAVAPLLDTTEARYGEISRKMAELNDWITPWFDHGVPYWGKPPLAFWVTAISFKLFGVNEFSARLPHLIISMLIVGLAVWLAARRDRHAALPTLALISGSSLFFVSSGVVMTDIELILGTTLTMAGFWLAKRLPVWWTVSLALGMELFVGVMIRDNLTLNVLMLLWPVQAIKSWQMGG